MIFWKENRESVKQFFAKYGKIGKKVFEDSSEEEEEEEEDKKKEKEEEEKGEEEYICALLKKKKKKKGDDVKMKLIKDVSEILEVIQKERSQVADIVHVISESNDGEQMKGNLAVMSLIQGNLRDQK